MKSIQRSDVVAFVEENIQQFHQRRIEKLQQQQLKKILKNKNPYLFKAKHIITAQDLVRDILDAFLSSQEEGIFGGFLEDLAIFVCGKVYGGEKSHLTGLDLEFVKHDVYYIVQIKSGPKWGNSAQIVSMKNCFQKAADDIRQRQPDIDIVAINGCCYGKEKNLQKDGYLKLCGQVFWEFISGDPDLYIEIVEPLGYRAKERNEAFTAEYARVINKFTKEFLDAFCDSDGSIHWDKLVQLTSARL